MNVIVGEPQGVANYIPSIWEMTNPELAIVRLHGRNHETWAKKGLTSSAQRFNYDCSDAELEELAKPITQLARNSFATHVILNNNHEDQGQRNAATLRTILQRRKAHAQ